MRTEGLLERAQMKSLSQEVKARIWKMIGHTLRQDQENDGNVAMTWAPEGTPLCNRPSGTRPSGLFSPTQ